MSLKSVTPHELLEDKYPGSSKTIVEFRKKILHLCSKEMEHICKAVFIEGEIGVGKSYLARVIAALREVRENNQPSFKKELKTYHANFREIITPSGEGALIDSEIFGHVKGAFTGADDEKPAIFENSSNKPDINTVFFDEIGRASNLTQTKLLGVYGSKRYKKVGGSDTRETKALFISASNQNLANLVIEKSFLEELKSRLGIVLRVPPLRENPELIKTSLCELVKKSTRKVEEKDMVWAETYSWPWNRRQIETAMQNYAFHTDKSFRECVEMSGPGNDGSLEFTKEKQAYIVTCQLNFMLESKLKFNGTASEFIKTFYTDSALEALHAWTFDSQRRGEEIESVFSQDAKTFKNLLANAISKRRKVKASSSGAL